MRLYVVKLNSQTVHFAFVGSTELVLSGRESHSAKICPVISHNGFVWLQCKLADLWSYSMSHTDEEAKPECVKCPFCCEKTFNSAKENFALHEGAKKFTGTQLNPKCLKKLWNPTFLLILLLLSLRTFNLGGFYLILVAISVKVETTFWIKNTK